jgi:hypothetical protein
MAEFATDDEIADAIDAAEAARARAYRDTQLGIAALRLERELELAGDPAAAERVLDAWSPLLRRRI